MEDEVEINTYEGRTKGLPDTDSPVMATG